MNPSRNRQKVKRLLKEFLKQLRGFLKNSDDFCMEDFMRIESKRSKYNRSVKGTYERYF
jgi:hypothetical protein